MAGRRPKPTAMKVLAGNPGHRPLNDAEPQPERTAPEMPKGMAKAARREWDAIVPMLLRNGVLTTVDGKALAAYCDAYAHWEMARKEIERHGLVIEEPVLDQMHQPTGYVRFKANPAVSIYNTFGKLMKSFLIEFGLTPASRTKLKISPPKEVGDPLEELLSRKPGAVQAAKENAPLHFDVGVAAKSVTPDLMALPDSSTDFDA